MGRLPPFFRQTKRGKVAFAAPRRVSMIEPDWPKYNMFALIGSCISRSFIKCSVNARQVLKDVEYEKQQKHSFVLAHSARKMEFNVEKLRRAR